METIEERWDGSREEYVWLTDGLASVSVSVKFKGQMCVLFQGQSFLENKLEKNELNREEKDCQRMVESKLGRMLKRL